MGLDLGSLQILIKLARDGLLKNVSRIADIGSADIFCQNNENLLQDFYNSLNAPVPHREELTRLCNLGPARDLYQSLGFEYICIDLDGRHGALVLDIDQDSLPREHVYRYELTMNLGTTEHLINQLNGFRLVHDLTSVGGLMFHVLPCTGLINHGMFRYNPQFFTYLADWNQSKPLPAEAGRFVSRLEAGKLL